MADEQTVTRSYTGGWAVLLLMFLSCWIGMIAGLTQYVIAAVFG